MIANLQTGIQSPVARVASTNSVSVVKQMAVHAVVKPKSVSEFPIAPASKANTPDFSKPYTLTYQSQSPDVLFIGGSNLVYWRHRVLQEFPTAIIDARTGRPFIKFANVYEKLSGYKAIIRINTLVISWSSGGSFNDGALSTLLAEADGKTVYLVPGANAEKSVSDFFKTFHSIYPKVYLVNFNSLARRNPEYFKQYAKGLSALSPVGIVSWLSFLKLNMVKDYFDKRNLSNAKPVSTTESEKKTTVKNGG